MVPIGNRFHSHGEPREQRRKEENFSAIALLFAATRATGLTSDSSPVWSGLQKSMNDGGKGLGPRDFEVFQHPLANGEVTAFSKAIGAAPGGRSIVPP